MKRPTLWIPFLLLVTAGCVTLMIHTESGLQWSFRLAQILVPGQLDTQRLSGRLTGPLEISGLRYRDDIADVRIGRITLDWRPLSLFAGRVTIRNLVVEDGDIALAGAAQAPDEQPAGVAMKDFALTLPVKLAIDHIEFRNIALRLAEQDPLTFDRLEFRAVTHNDEIVVDDFHLDADSVSVDAEGRLPLSTAGPLQVTARVRAEIAGRHWSGTTTLSGTPAAIDARLSIDHPLGAIGEAQLQLLADPPRWNASIGIDPFALDDLVPAFRPIRIQAAEIEASGRGAVMDISGLFAVRDIEFGSWGVDLEGRVDGSRREIRHFMISALDGAARISGEAMQTTGESGRDDHYEVGLRWENLAWPPIGDAQALGPQGSANITGTLADYRFSTAGIWLLANLPPLDLALEGDGNTNGVNLRELHGKFIDGDWRGAGKLEWRPALHWELALTTNGINPVLFHPELSGNLDGQLTMTGSYNETLALDVDIARLGGSLREFPFDSHARIVIADSITEIRDLFMRSGGIELTGAAHLDDQWDINWKLAATDFHVLHPDFDGVAQSTGTASGPPDALRMRFNLDAGDLSWLDHGIGTLKLSADLGLGATGKWQAALVTDGARIANHDIGRIMLDVDGTALDHRIGLRIEGDQHLLEQRLAGALQDGRWRAVLNEGRFEEVRIGEWKQRDGARLDITSDSLELDDFCWQQEAAILCLRGDRDADARMRAWLTLRDFALSRLDAWLPDNRAGMTGSMDGALEVRFEEGALGFLQLDLRSTPGLLTYPLPNHGELHTLAFESIAFSARTEDPQGLRGDLNIILNEREHLVGEFRLPEWRGSDPLTAPELELQGKLNLALQDVDVITLLLPELETGHGSITAGIGISGTVGAPRIDGDMQLALDYLAIARFNVRLDDLKFEAGIRNNDWTLAGSGRIDQGHLALAGHGTVHNLSDWRAEVTLNGENLKLLTLPTAEIVTSPAVIVRISPDDLVFDGSLNIPRARLEPVKPESVEPVSGDIVIIGAEDTGKPPSQFKIHGRIELVLGDQVRLIGKGFEGRLTGQLLLLLDRDGNLNGQGEIRVVDGRYRAYGQNLTISQGRVLYAGGSLDNPAIDITASRMRGDVEVGVRVTGTAEKPQVVLFSNPAMDDADVLSYLLIGRPMDQAAESEAMTLHSAATSAALVGGEALAGRISDQFNLAEVSIEAGDNADDAALVLGTELSQGLHLRYVQGLVENTSALQLRYKLSDMWTIETESGTRSGAGADILFTLER